MKLAKGILTKFIIMISACAFAAPAADEHGHSTTGSTPKKTQASEAEHSDHEDHASEEKEHGEDSKHAGHGEGEGAHKEAKGEEAEEGSSAVGPEKGIVEKGPLGFKLSPEATKTINFKTIDYTGGNFTIPKVALVKSKNEKSIFRFRQGWIKRIPLEIQSKLPESIVGKSSELVAGDKIIVTEVGILMVSEIFSEGGASHGHSH